MYITIMVNALRVIEEEEISGLMHIPVSVAPAYTRTRPNTYTHTRTYRHANVHEIKK